MSSVNHTKQMQDRLLMQFHSSPVFKGLLAAIGSEMEGLTAVYEDLRYLRWIDTGEGQQLDGCGEIVQQSRTIKQAIAIAFFGFDGQTGATGFGQGRIRKNREAYLTSAKLADAEYRQILWSKVAKNTTDGTAESTIDSLYRLYAAKIVVAETGNAKIRIAIGRELTEAEILLANALNLLVRAGGVGIQVKSYFIDGSAFGFSNQNQGYLGFGTGILAKEF